MNPDQVRSDAEAMAEAWREQLHAEPTIHALVLAVAQGTFETQMGRAWPGSFNVGACTLRGLTSEELGAVTAAGLHPTLGANREQICRAAEAAILAAGLPLASGVNGGVTIPTSQIHSDSRPVPGGGTEVYFCFFAAFGSLVDGCRYYLHLAAEGKPARAVLENPAGTEQSFAAALRAQGYYTGRFDNSTPEGWQKNVDAYANALRALTPGIRAALAGWQPSSGPIPVTPAPVPPFNLSTISGQWRALQALGCVRPMREFNGDTAYWLPAALGFYQGGSLAVDGVTPLDVDGRGGPQTQAAMARDLRALGFEVIQ